MTDAKADDATGIDWRATTERSARAVVVAAARAWRGTPYHHMADLKGIGCDCAMLLVRVYCDLGLVEKFDPRPYTRDWMLHRDDERFLGFLLARAHEVASPLPGDVILFKYGRGYSHGGIVTKPDPLTIVHAFHPARRVVEEEIGRNAEVHAHLGDAKFASYWCRNTEDGRQRADDDPSSVLRSPLSEAKPQ
jgi:cell wall-associated NlpC family hydrolase